MVNKSLMGLGPTKASYYGKINEDILARFAESDNTEEERETNIHSFGEEDDDDLEVIKTDHIPLRGDRDYPPGILMVMDDVTEYSRERRRSEEMMRQLIDALVNVVERRDPHTVHQSSRISEVSRAIAREMETSDDVVKTVDIAGNLINLGRVFIPGEVLAKKGGLKPSEEAMFDNSYKESVELLKNVSFEGPVVDTISQTGENWDGSGAKGMKEDETFLSARILAVAAAFISKVCPRTGEPPLSFNEAAAELMLESGRYFDRKPVSALINYIDNRGGAEKWAHFQTPEK